MRPSCRQQGAGSRSPPRSGLSRHVWDMGSLNKWWAGHQSNYTDWPHEHYNSGIDFFEHVNYLDALESFKKVLEVDSDADKSRALAVACAVEIGNIELAKNMFESFKAKDSRWAKWGQTKITLVTEGAERATKMLAGLSREYRTFPVRAFIHPRVHVWRQIDWSLYDRLVKEEK